MLEKIQEGIHEVEEQDGVQKGTFEMVCCGSYRRERSHCGDIDILISRRDREPFGRFLVKLIELLEEGGLLKERL